MTESILNSIKTTLGLADDYTAFDQEIILHINSVLGTLNQLGIGPDDGFAITDDTQTWEEFLGAGPDGNPVEKRYNPVKSYVSIRVKLLFDPPQVGYVLTAMEKMKEEAEWRINAMREDIVHPYVAPVVPAPYYDPMI